MSWTAQDPKTRSALPVSEQTQEQYDAEKQRSLPTIRKEAAEGAPGFQPIQFQPVRSPGLYDAQFGLKGEDLIFQFWPGGYTLATSEERARMRFPAQFEQKLKQAMGDVFGSRFRASLERDVDSWFVCAAGYALNQFHRDLAIRACERLHYLLGGKEG